MVAGAYTMSHACNKHTHTWRISSVCSFNISILPHVVADCRRCIVLGTGGRSILGHITQGYFERNVIKKCSVFKVGMSNQRRTWCICMAKLSVRPQTAHSREVFIQRRCSIEHISLYLEHSQMLQLMTILDIQKKWQTSSLV